MEKTIFCNNPGETRNAAIAFAVTLKPGDVVALHGELGAGKTTFVRMVARHLGYDGVVNSPTFTLMNIYKTDKLALYHFDFYRISNEIEALGFGADEFIGASDTISFIEWPERAPGVLPEKHHTVEITIPDFTGSPEAREIRIS